MTKSFEVALTTDPYRVIGKAKKAAEQHGATFTGDTHSGKFSGNGLEGEYQVEDKTVVITITQKPALIPWSSVETQIKSFFETEFDHGERLNQALMLNERKTMMTKRQEAEQIVTSHVLWSVGAGLIPLPIFDLAAVTAIQVDMLQQLADLYQVDYSKSMGKTFVSALAGSTLAKIGATVVKAIPGIGSLIGGISMSALSGASTYAIGQVVINHLEASGDFLNIDLGWARRSYDEAFEQGKGFVSGLKEKEEAAQDLFQALERLGQLKQKGIITAEEFEAQKQKLLGRL